MYAGRTLNFSGEIPQRMGSENKTRVPGGVVRKCKREDVRAIQAILAESPEAAFWSLQSIDDVLKQSWVSALVSERDGTVTGFIVGRKAAEEGEILNLAIRVADRRRGDGNALVAELLKEFQHLDIERVFLEVRESNTGAIQFYKRLGFGKVGQREGYYQQPTEAAWILQKILKSTAGVRGGTE
jgi:[ribosomal protein S18]-alanine N-acetyltransferase